MIGLVDCNNFFVSCERVFQPDLNNKPVVVLSNNDGCIIARSNEAKDLGIKMGEPFFKVKTFLLQHNVHVFSSNYALYADMSRRIMTLLTQLTPSITQYSIDECFVDLNGINNLHNFAKHLVDTILHGTGIPVTIGIATSKTLAKAASHFGKKYKAYQGVCIIDNDDKRTKALQMMTTSNVWGIGHQHAQMLQQHGIITPLDLIHKNKEWVQKHMSITGVRTWQELQGIDCIDINDLPQKKSLACSRSFPDRGINTTTLLEEATANFAATISRKLRQQHSLCNMITVYAYTSRYHSNDNSAHVINQTIPFYPPTNDTSEIVGATVDVIRKHFRQGALYKKAGVIAWELCNDNAVQGNLFDTINRQKRTQLMKTIDDIDHRNGRNTVRVAAQGHDTRWQMKSEHRSPRYTTTLQEVININTAAG